MSNDVFDRASLNLISTKLHRPAPSGDLVHRARLLELLDQGRSRPLTLVSAPAGSGKTMLLADWLSTCPCRSAWLSLDEGDGNLTVFLSYLIAAVRTLFPTACAQTLSFLQASELPPLRVLAGHLINEIASLRDELAQAGETSFVLVLDDYHLISGQAVNQLLAEALRHPLATMHLVLATRSDPALPLASLRARGQLAEIRRQHLRFSVDEARAYLQQATHRVISQELVAALTQQTEGWITGLRLAALALRHATDSAEFLAGLSASQRYVMDYLMDEVLSRQPSPIQDFLLKTSVLDRLCEPLCAAVTASLDLAPQGQPTLQWLEQANLFTVALDDRQRWYRYHHLFQQFLRHRLEQQFESTQVADLHSRASRWYAENGFVDDAIAHALAAGDEMAVVRIIEAHRHAAMNQERWQQLDHWLNQVPRRLVDERPELLLLEAWILQRQWRLGDIAAILDRIEAIMASLASTEAGPVALRAEIDALRSLVCYFRLDGEGAFAAASRALQTLPMACSSVRGLAWMYFAGGRQAVGDIQGAHAALYAALNEDRFHLNSFPARVLMALCVIHWVTADLAGLKQAATYYIKLANERNLQESIWWARYFRGCAAYQMNDLAAAESDFAAVVEQRYLAHGFVFSQSAFGLASIWQAQGEGQRAVELVESVLAYGYEMNNTRVLTDGQAFRSWLALRQGRRAEAMRWAETVDPNGPLLPMTTFHVAAITLAKVLLDPASPSHLKQAGHLLARLHSHVDATHNTRFKVEVLALTALLEDALGREDATLATLCEAVTLALPTGLLRVFVDQEPRLARLLVRLAAQGSAPADTARILSAFGPAPSLPAHRFSAAPAPQSGLFEPLTDRELDVLALLAQRLSAKEIAQALVISPRTAKRHTANIYQKLGVNSRREAVAAAMGLGLLPAQP